MSPDDEMAQAADERVARLVELARLRRETRKAVRSAMARRRAHGLAERHKSKLDRVRGDGDGG